MDAACMRTNYISRKSSNSLCFYHSVWAKSSAKAHQFYQLWRLFTLELHTTAQTNGLPLSHSHKPGTKGDIEIDVGFSIKIFLTTRIMKEIQTKLQFQFFVPASIPSFPRRLTDTMKNFYYPFVDPLYDAVASTLCRYNRLVGSVILQIYPSLISCDKNLKSKTYPELTDCSFLHVLRVKRLQAQQCFFNRLS